MTDQNKEHAPRVSRGIVRRMMRLLHMEYKPSEIAKELGISTKTIYETYIPAGLPHRRDPGGNIWIVGTVFREWAGAALEQGHRYAHQRRLPIGPHQSYCVKCKTVREFAKITRRVPYSGKRLMVHGTCSVCGSKMTSFKSKEQMKEASHD